MAEEFKVYGLVIEGGTQDGAAGLRVELWDKDLLADDLVGTATTDAAGKFEVGFDETYFRELFFDRVPDIFVKLFDGCRLIYSSEGERAWKLKPGENEIEVELDLSEEPDTNRLLDLYIIKPTTLYDAPQGNEIETLAPSSWVAALEAKGNGFVVRTDKGRTGWVTYDDLDDLHRKILFVNGDSRPNPILKPEIVDAVWKATAPGEHAALLDALGKKLRVLDDLLRLSQGVLRVEPIDTARFDTVLRELIDQFAPPPRPSNFTLTALRREIDLRATGQSRFFGNIGLPCLPDLGSIGLIGAAVLRTARRRSPLNPVISEDLLWAGLWVLGDLLDAANHVGMLHQSIENGFDEMTQVLTTRIADPQRMQVAGFLPNRPSPPGESAIPASMFWEPGRFPGAFRFPAFDCRVEQWDRTIRGIRCCGQTYRIDSVTTDGCYGDIVVIRGAGFSNSRFWPFVHAPEGDGSTDPAHLATPGPIENKVIFPAADGGVRFGEDFISFDREETYQVPNPDTGELETRTRTVTYLGWADDEIRVLLPAETISGELELRIVCDESVRGRTVDYATCGIQMRLPNHGPEDARAVVRAAVVTVGARIGDTVHYAPPGRAVTVEAEACVGIPILIDGINLREVRIEDGRGDRVAFPEGDLGPDDGRGRPITAGVTVTEADDETYTITTLDACGYVKTFIITVNRYHTCHLTTSSSRYSLATETEVPVTCRLSCDPEELDLENLQVRLGFSGSPPGATFEDVVLTVPSGSLTAATTVSLGPIACGTYRVAGQILEAGLRRRPCSTDFDVTGLPITVAFTGGVVVRLFSPTGSLSPLLRARYTGTVAATLRFSADRSTVTILGFTVTGIRFVTITQTGGGVGPFTCGTGDFRMPITLSINSDILEATLVNDGVLSTGMLSTPSGMLSGTGSPADGAGAITIVGAGTGTGGIAHGVEVFITLTGTMTPAPPSCCGAV